MNRPHTREQKMTLIEYVKRIFEEPEMSDGCADMILWNCTGFPAFWTGDPIKCLTKQLRHAKRSLARGFTIDQVGEGTDRLKKSEDK